MHKVTLIKYRRCDSYDVLSQLDKIKSNDLFSMILLTFSCLQNANSFLLYFAKDFQYLYRFV